jgi:DNA-binding IclR family transcriptional regulator
MSKIVERTLDCFELFADQKQPLSLSDISRLLGIPPSSCHDVLKALRKRGYLYELAPRGGFYPTLRLHDIAKTIAEHDPVLLRADVLLKSLRDALDETVNLSKVNGLTATYLLSFESSQPLRLSVKVGDNIRSLHATSAGKALLASLDEKAFALYLKTADLKRFTPLTVSSKNMLREQIEEGRRLGWFVNRGESIEGVTTLSAPFHWQESLYFVTVAGPAARIDPKIAWAAQLLMDVCRRLEMHAESPKA